MIEHLQGWERALEQFGWRAGPTSRMDRAGVPSQWRFHPGPLRDSGNILKGHVLVEKICDYHDAGTVRTELTSVLPSAGAEASGIDSEEV